MSFVSALPFLLSAFVTLRGEAPKPVRIAGPGYEGAIVSAEAQVESDRRLKRTQVWTPSDSDVREAERLLPEYLGSADAASLLRGSRINAELPRYKRQYWGVTRSGRQEILIHFYHEATSVGKKALWLRGIVAVNGGGDQFFRVAYQVEKKRFAGLQINAPE